MNCQNCGETLPDRAKYCPQCGELVCAPFSDSKRDAKPHIPVRILAENVTYRDGYPFWGKQSIRGKLVADDEGLHFVGSGDENFCIRWNQMVQRYGHMNNLLPSVRWDEQSKNSLASGIIDIFMPSFIGVTSVTGMAITYKDDAGYVHDVFFQHNIFKLKGLIASISKIRAEMMSRNHSSE